MVIIGRVDHAVAIAVGRQTGPRLTHRPPPDDVVAGIHDAVGVVISWGRLNDIQRDLVRADIQIPHEPIGELRHLVQGKLPADAAQGGDDLKRIACGRRETFRKDSSDRTTQLNVADNFYLAILRIDAAAGNIGQEQRAG